MNKRFHLKPVAAILLAGLLGASPVFSKPAISEEVTFSAGQHISPQDEETISATAVKVLRHIAEARGALQGENADSEKAKAQLDQSGKLLDIIQAALPTARIKDHIWVAGKQLEYESSREVLPDMIPIYASLEELVDYLPRAKAKASLEKAGQAVNEGDKSTAQEQLRAVDDALLYLEADLPLRSTRNLVDQARDLLAAEDTKGADQALAFAEDNVVFVSMSFDSPLTEAKAALTRAVQNQRLGEKAYAKADLDAAVSQLERAAQSTDPITRDKANDLVGAVRELNAMLETDNQDFSLRAQSAWHRVKAMSERNAEYISTGWQRFRADDGVRKALIEAKLQLAYARIDRFIAKDPAAAKVEIAEAMGYLEAAAQKVPALLQEQVNNLTGEVGRLSAALESNNTQGAKATDFHHAEQRLATLIARA